MLIEKVLITDNIADICPQILRNGGLSVDVKTNLGKDQLVQEIKNYDALVVRSQTKVTADVISAGKGKLKLIGRAGTGVDNIDIGASKANGIVVLNTPMGNTMSAAEHTCAMIMACSRFIPQGNLAVREGRWKDRKNLMGNEVFGKTLAIIGLGRIGREVATRMQSFGMKTIGFDPLVPPEESAKFDVEGMSIDKIWPLADYITVHVPLIPPTKNLIGDSMFSQAKDGVRIINVARGGVVDENALVRALNSGKCAGAALDVFLEEPPTNRELLDHPKVVTTPHLGASTYEAQTRVAEDIAKDIVRAAKGEQPEGIVN